MIIAVDFDGTIVTHEYPNIGTEVPYAIGTLRELIDNGNQIVLCTMRGHKERDGRDLLQEAVDWLKERGVELYGVNEEPFQSTWTDSPKPYAELYIDDSALGCPQKIDEKLGIIVDWREINNLFTKSGLINTVWV